MRMTGKEQILASSSEVADIMNRLKDQALLD